MNLLRLRGRKLCERVLRQGRPWKGKNMTIRWMMGAPRHPAANPETPAIYVGTVASVKLHKSAVKRNRMRRRCREALRILLKDWPDFGPVQLLIFPRSSSLDAPFADIERDFRTFLPTLPSWPKQQSAAASSVLR